jgi:hypothetical protein
LLSISALAAHRGIIVSAFALGSSVRATLARAEPEDDDYWPWARQRARRRRSSIFAQSQTKQCRSIELLRSNLHKRARKMFNLQMKVLIAAGKLTSMHQLRRVATIPQNRENAMRP